ncbi:MAG TPA: cobalamin-dependent protein [Luteitalea sp.]|nr:cobalamin-dependent protein [Luteitalea sp.]
MTDAIDWTPIRAAYLDAQLAGDRRRAVSLVADLLRDDAVDRSAVRSRVIREAQREIGRLWQENTISIAQEHVATAISQLALAEVYRHEPPTDRNGLKIVVACVDGELHDMPARLVADELDVAGFDVRYLGASVPTHTLLSFLAAQRPHLVVLSATMAFHADAVRDAVRRIRADWGPALPIAIGGQVCEWIGNLGSELDVQFAGCDVAELLEVASRVAGRP